MPEGEGPKDSPWVLKTPPGSSEYEMYRARFAMYVPPLMEELGLAELEHNPRNNRMRAV